MISDDARRFVLTSIPSVLHMEAVVLFQRSPDVRSDATALAEALYLAAARSTVVLVGLHAAGILVADSAPGGYGYRPRTDELAVLVERRAVLYSTHVAEYSRDRLFLFLTAPFWIEAANRTALAIAGTWSEAAEGNYLVRLLSYSLILVAIWDKNRPGR